MVRKILLCTDGSESARRAAQYTAELARSLKVEVVLVSVFNPPVGASLWAQEPLPAKLDDIVSTGETVAEALTNGSKAILAGAGVPFSTHVELGDPVQMILEIAKAENADLIVVGSRGQDGFSSLLLGSVSDSIAHHASCPVLIVR